VGLVVKPAVIERRVAVRNPVAQPDRVAHHRGELAGEDAVIGEHVEGRLDTVTASMAKYRLSDTQGKVIDRCLQLFGGYGYMDEYPISRLYRDARVLRIYAGTNEIMKLLIARSL